MRFALAQPDLRQALTIAGRFVATRSTLPVITNLLLSADTASTVAAPTTPLRISATNLEMSITLDVPATVDEPGAITLPARLLTDLVNALPSAEPVAFDVSSAKSSARITCGRNTTTVKGVAASEFPLLPAMPATAPITLAAWVLREAIERVAFAAAEAGDTGRPALTSVCLSADAGTLCFAATDGFRLSRTCVALDLPDGALPANALLPARAAAEIARICAGADPEANVAVAVEPGRVVCAIPGQDSGWQRAVIAAQLIDARFPDISAIIPTRHDAEVAILIADLHRALRPARLFARDSNDRVLISAQADDPDTVPALIVEAVSAETGDSRSHAPAIRIDGTVQPFAINAVYLDELLASLAGEEQVLLHTTKPDRPIIFTLPGADHYVHVIMPMQIAR